MDRGPDVDQTTRKEVLGLRGTTTTPQKNTHTIRSGNKWWIIARVSRNSGTRPLVGGSLTCRQVARLAAGTNGSIIRKRGPRISSWMMWLWSLGLWYLRFGAGRWAVFYIEELVLCVFSMVSMFNYGLYELDLYFRLYRMTYDLCMKKKL